MKRNIADLKSKGTASKTAWPASYWPTYEDGINNRWQGSDELSPAEKYDAAFNGWDPASVEGLRPWDPDNCSGEFDKEYYEKLGPLAKFASKNKGNWRSHDGVDSNADGNIDECSSTDGNDGVETWFGLCHAWVPASMLEDEPKKAVTKNGVTFEVSDIKALLIASYDRSDSTMLGGRCNDAGDKVTRDEFGRITSDACRDTNPGSLHVIMTNLLGEEGRGFAFDRTWDYQVWNQPVTGYEILDQKEVTETEALAKLGRTDVTAYPYNKDAKRWVSVRAKVFFVVESVPMTTPTLEDIARYTRSDTYEYVLELDADGNIIGGEWLTTTSYGSRYTALPDFLWFPKGPGFPSFNTLDLETVRELVRLSREDEVGEGEVVVVKSDKTLEIKDNSTISNSLKVEGLVAAKSVKLTLDVTHTWIGDLIVTVEHNGVTVNVHNKQGGSKDDIKETFELTDFNGVNAEGAWTLTVVDGASGDEGTVNSWELEFDPSND
jgi:hypothetical protein